MEQVADQGRLVVLAGDLANPLFGLPREDYERLGRRVSTIWHAGSQVNHAGEYEVMKASNVGGTTEILRLAALRGGTTVVHYVSTIRYGNPLCFSLPSIMPMRGFFFRSVLGADGTERDEGDVKDMRRAGGYASSKWVAEMRVRAAIGRKVCQGVIYRPGLLSPDTVGAARCLPTQLCYLNAGFRRSPALPTLPTG